jgi:hypothetical protein
MRRKQKFADAVERGDTVSEIKAHSVYHVELAK